MTNSATPEGFNSQSDELPTNIDQAGGINLDTWQATKETKTAVGSRRSPGLMEPHDSDGEDFNTININQVGSEPVPREVMVTYHNPQEIIPHIIDSFNRGLIGTIGSYTDDMCSSKDWNGSITNEKAAVLNRIMEDLIEFRRCELHQKGEVEEVIDNVYKVDLTFIGLTKAIYIPAMNNLTEAKIIEEDRTYVFTFNDEGELITNIQRKRSNQRDGDQNYEWNFVRLMRG